MAVPSLAAPAPVLRFLSPIASPSPSSWGSSCSSVIAASWLQGVVIEPQPGSLSSPGTPSSSGSAKGTTPVVEMPTSPSSPSRANNATTPFGGEMPAPDVPKEEDAAFERGRQSSSSSSSSSSLARSSLHLDTAALGSTSTPMPPPEDESQSEEAKPGHWARTWSEEMLARAVDADPFQSDGGSAAPTEAPQVQTMPELDEAAAMAGGSGSFDPDRIPASAFQPRTSVSQAEWSITSNESLFSIQGHSADRSEGDANNKLPPLAEGAEAGDAFAVPGSAGSHASDGGAKNKAAAVFRRHESGSGGSSSNFSFAFPILAETSPKDCVTAALYQSLQSEYEQPTPPPLAPPVSLAFVEMTTEEERMRRSDGWCCCGCCWFDCSCRCCRWQWWRCDCCRCSCPSLCACNWCLCF